MALRDDVSGVVMSISIIIKRDRHLAAGRVT